MKKIKEKIIKISLILLLTIILITFILLCINFYNVKIGDILSKCLGFEILGFIIICLFGGDSGPEHPMRP